MPAPALASSFRQQAGNLNNNDNAGGKMSVSNGGYGNYGYNGSSNNMNNSDNGGGDYQRQYASEDMQQQQSRGEYGQYGMPSSSSNIAASRPHQQQQHQQQSYQQQHRQNSVSNSMSNGDMRGSLGGDNNSYMSNSNGATSTSPTSTSGGNGSGPGTGPGNGGGGPSSSTATSNKAAIGSPEEIENSRRIARLHFEEFRAYLDAEGQRDPNARANAREKLTRLTRPQFQELSTDVYDELIRRQKLDSNSLSGNAPEYLPQKSDFHPKRNQARQKLSTLPKTRFRDLASDVYFELERRYPEFKESEIPLPAIDEDDDEEAAGLRGGDGSYGSSSSNSAPLTRPPYSTSTSGSTSQGPQIPQRSGSRDDGQSAGPRLQSTSSGRRPQFPQGKPTDYGSGGSRDQQQSQSQPPSTSSNTTTANEVIIPNKSKVIEEDISLPDNNTAMQSSLSQQSSQSQRGYGNYANQNGYIGRKSSDRERPTVNINGVNSNGSYRDDGGQDPPSPSNLQFEPPRRSNDTPRLGNGPLQPTSPDWASSVARASEASSLGARLIGGYGSNSEAGGNGGGQSRDWEASADDLEKVKSDYEYKIATMQNRMTNLEKDLRESQEIAKMVKHDNEDKLRELEGELQNLKQRHEDALNNIENLEQDLLEAQERAAQVSSHHEAAAAAAAASSSSSAADKEEISRLQNELDSFKNKYRSQQDATDNLRNEIEGLVDTLKEMNLRQDDLANGRDADQSRIEELTEEVREWKGRYESAKTELRELKATSQLFVRPTKADDDYMPMSLSGAIMDSHVTRFQSSIDDLLITGRSDAPSSVIIATKQVINAVTRIDEDVQEYENAGMADSLSPDDRERLHALKSKCNATLSNLTTAARNHATGHGLSPVSLLDAAASHLSNTIIELVRLLLMRKAGTPLLTPDLSHTSMNKSTSQSSLASSSRHDTNANVIGGQSQSQSRGGFPTRLASLKREEESTGYSPSQNNSNTAGSSGRASPASYRSRTVTMSDRTQATSPEPHMKSDSSFSNATAAYDNKTPNVGNSKMNASESETSLASNFHSDPRRQAYQQQHQQQSSQQSMHSESSPRLLSHQANDSHTSMRSGHSAQSYNSDNQDRRPDFGEDRNQQDERDYDERDQNQKQDLSEDPEAWADLKNYLESQTEAIVHSITALLAAIRGGAQPIKLQENLSQIITIVSSIVQILRDNLPSQLHEESEPTIEELSQNCQKLIDLQNSAEGSTQAFSKQTKQAMATASFGVAKSLKAINGILASV